MWTGQIAFRYAKALYRYAAESGNIHQVYAEVLALQQVLTQVKNMRVMLANPVLPAHRKLSLLQQVVQGTPSHQYTRFCQLVLNKKREGYLLFIVHSFVLYYKQQQHIVSGKVVSATPLTATQLQQLRQLINHYCQGNVELEEQVDENMLGGFVLQFDTYRLDASVDSQLRNIKQQLMQRNSKIV